MKANIFFTLFCLFSIIYPSSGQLYFPPSNGSWQTVDPASLQWNTSKIDELKTFLTDTDTKAFIVLKDGKIAMEYYFNGHDESKSWYWASAGKSLTSTLVAIAEAEGKIDLQAPSSIYLGNAWAEITPEQMNEIKVWHHITMTTGLDESVSFECTEPACLKYKAKPGTRWSYHNAPYTIIDKIIEGATGSNLNLYFKNKIGDKIGLKGAFIKTGDNNIFYSTAQNMARFGLLNLANGKWNGQSIIDNPSYISAMKNTSQNLNKSYGYLWWLNGKGSFMLPGSQLVFPLNLVPSAPSDMYCGLGKNDQKVYIVPSQNLVVVRMGDKGTPGDNPVPIEFDEALWQRLSVIFNLSSSTEDHPESDKKVCHYDGKNINIDQNIEVKKIHCYDLQGRNLISSTINNTIETSNFNRGIYIVSIEAFDGRKWIEKVFVY